MNEHHDGEEVYLEPMIEVGQEISDPLGVAAANPNNPPNNNNTCHSHC